MFEIFVGRTCGNRNHIFWFVARYSIHYTKVLLKWHSLRESNTLLQIWSLRHNTHIPRLLVARLRVELRSPVSETRVQAVIPPGIKWSECHASSMISPFCSLVYIATNALLWGWWVATSPLLQLLWAITRIVGGAYTNRTRVKWVLQTHPYSSIG